MEGTRAVHAAYNSAALLAMAMLGSSACRTRNSERPYDPSTSSGKRASSSAKRPRSNLHTNGESQTIWGPIRKRRGTTCWDAIPTTVPIQAPSQRRTSQLTCRQKLQTQQPEAQQQPCFPILFRKRVAVADRAMHKQLQQQQHTPPQCQHLSRRGAAAPRFQKMKKSVMRKALAQGRVSTEIRSEFECLTIQNPPKFDVKLIYSNFRFVRLMTPWPSGLRRSTQA
jgi:hypothetical protein